MTREWALAIMIALGVLLLIGMTLSILSRRQRGAALDPLPLPGDITGDVIASFTVLYVATTPSNNPLERVWASPLAYRAKARIDVRSGGLVFALTGEGDMGIPAESLTGVGRGTWTIDKAVDPEGLVVVTWRHAGKTYDSYFRSVDYRAQDVIDPITRIIIPTVEEAE
jgi:hypothetical protein